MSATCLHSTAAVRRLDTREGRADDQGRKKNCEGDSGHRATNAWNRIEMSFLCRADTTWTYENVSEIINRELQMARLRSCRC
jgi:hypothetical protein